MKWFLVGILVCLARYGEGGAIKCEPEDDNPSCRDLEKGIICESGSVDPSCRALEKVKDSELKQGRSCEPETSWRSQCNDCVCSPEGLSFCTERACVDHENEQFKECAPDSTWKNECNRCTCNTDGRAMCTRMECPSFHEHLKNREEDEERPDAAFKSSKNNTQQKIVCVANRMFIKDCNTCWCNDDGTGFFCTRKVCVPELPEDASEEEKPEKDFRIIKRECRPDEVFELDCNMCRCNPDGKSFSCTRRACLELIDEDAKNMSRKKRGVAQEPLKNCQPGQEFRMDCNKCLCDDKGQDFSCTRIDCNALNNNNGGARAKRDTSEKITMECSPSSVFDRDCNVCRCTEDGHAATCTTKPCSAPASQSQDNDVNSPIPGPDPNFRCNPGEQFKRGCNDCSCSADGKSVFCTVRFCDQDITPPPSL